MAVLYIVYVLVIVPLLVSPLIFILGYLPFDFIYYPVILFLDPIVELVTLNEPFNFFVIYPAYSAFVIAMSLIIRFLVRKKTGSFPKKFLLIAVVLIVLQPSIVFARQTLYRIHDDQEKREVIGDSRPSVKLVSYRKTDNLAQLTDENSYEAWKDDYDVIEYTIVVNDFPSKFDFYRLNIYPEDQNGELMEGIDQILFQRENGKWTYDGNFEDTDREYIPVPSDGKIVRYSLFDSDPERIEDINRIRFSLENEDDELSIHELEGTAKQGETVYLKP